MRMRPGGGYPCIVSDSKIRQKKWQILTKMRAFWNRNVAYIRGFNVITLNDKKRGKN